MNPCFSYGEAFSLAKSLSSLSYLYAAALLMCGMYLKKRSLFRATFSKAQKALTGDQKVHVLKEQSLLFWRDFFLSQNHSHTYSDSVPVKQSKDSVFQKALAGFHFSYSNLVVFILQKGRKIALLFRWCTEGGAVRIPCIRLTHLFVIQSC